MRTIKIVRFVGVIAAMLVPAAVVAASISFQEDEQLSAAKLNQLVGVADEALRIANEAKTAVGGGAGHGQCQVSVNTGDCGESCAATCAQGYVVVGGGCTMNAGGTMRWSSPGFAAGGDWPSQGDFVDELGSDPNNSKDPIWNAYGCAATEGTVQTVYALCCPL